jgi:hypothetical protein
LVLADRLPAICGSATDAIDVSSTSMKVGSITDAAIHHGLQSGHHSASGFALGSSGRVVSAGWMREGRACFRYTQPTVASIFCDSVKPEGTILTNISNVLLVCSSTMQG